METALKPVQNGRGRKRRWPAEQKLAVLQEWKNGIPLEEICRKYAINAAQMYRWKRSLDQGLKESGEMVPKSQVHGMFLSIHMPGARQAPELALLSATVRASVAREAVGCGRGDQQALGGKPCVLRIPAGPRPAQAPRSGLRSQDGVANHAPAWVAGDRSAPAGALRATARGAGASGRIEPAVGRRTSRASGRGMDRRGAWRS